MRNIRLRLQYEGTRYQGWQKQTSTDNTIQGKMEVLLTKMCGEPVEIAASGRTDEECMRWDRWRISIRNLT